MNRPKAINYFLGFILLSYTGGGIVASDLAFFLKKNFSQAEAIPERQQENKHLKTPEIVKAIYLTSQTPSTERFADILKLIDETELNAVVIDIKDSYGKPAYDSEVPLALKVGISKGKIKDLPALLQTLRSKGIYSIARIAVFQDPALVSARPDLGLRDISGKIWADRKGVTWADPASRAVWTYNAALAKEAAQLGFDEINFDYIRFASDGAVSRIKYPHWDGKGEKWEVMREFYKYLSDELKSEGVPISADLFGITLWRSDDVNIGQRLVDALAYFDYVSPMLYPSHFPVGFEGLANPADHPYEIYKRSIARGEITRATTTDARARFRPWVQDFDLGADYDASKVRAQIRGAMEEGSAGWMLWNARNVYTAGALERE